MGMEMMNKLTSGTWVGGIGQILDDTDPMSEIKCRVWNKNSKSLIKTINRDGVVVDLNCGMINDLGSIFGNGDSLVFQRFSGMCDRELVEIYEGDICVLPLDYIESEGGQNEPDIGTIEFYWGSFRFDGTNIDNYIYDESSAFMKVPKCELMVIGNIFENADLISK